jgi:diguanylate cyclase (GGDEF)-like protein
MPYSFQFYAAALFLSAVVSTYTAYLALKKRDKPGGTALFHLLIAMTFWSLFGGVRALSTTLTAKYVWTLVLYIGVVASVPLAILFILTFANNGRKTTARDRILLWSIPSLVLGLALTNHWHDLFWKDIQINPLTNLIEFTYGPAFWVFLVYVYTGILFGMLKLAAMLYRFRHIYRQQIYTMMSLLVISWLGNALYVADLDFIRNWDLTPITFTFAGVMLTWAIYRLDLFDYPLIDSHQVINNLQDMVFITNLNGLIIDFNQAFRKFIESQLPFGIENWKDLIGHPLDEVLYFWPDVLDRTMKPCDRHEEIHFKFGKYEKYFNLQIHTLNNAKQEPVARSYLLSNITPLKFSVQAAQKAVNIAEALHEIALKMNATLEMGEIFQTAIEQIERVISYDTAGITMIEGEDIVIRYEKGFERPETVMALHIPLAGSINEEALIRKEPLMYPRVQEVYEAYTKFPHDKIKSVLCIPLISQEEVLGFLTLDSHQIDHFNDEDLKIASTFASQVSIALRNSFLYKEMSQLAITDALTGLHNRRHFMELAETEVERAYRYKHPLSLIIFDLDKFKSINDTYGHGIGDRVLMEIARSGNLALRECDAFARYGGEEFVVLLPETNLERALQAAERLRKDMDAIAVQSGPDRVKVTASFGVSTLGEHCPNLDTLLSQADMALYLAKKKGRNRVETFEESSGPLV